MRVKRYDIDWMGQAIEESADGFFVHASDYDALAAKLALLRESRVRAGSKGGKATGKSKLRGDTEYYRTISQKAARARKAKRAKK